MEKYTFQTIRNHLLAVERLIYFIYFTHSQPDFILNKHVENINNPIKITVANNLLIVTSTTNFTSDNFGKNHWFNIILFIINQQYFNTNQN